MSFVHLKAFASTVLAEDDAFDNDDTSGSATTVFFSEDLLELPHERYQVASFSVSSSYTYETNTVLGLATQEQYLHGTCSKT